MVSEPLLLLDPDLRVLAASRSFHESFAIGPARVEGHLIYTIDDDRWDIPAIRDLLSAVGFDPDVRESTLVTQDLPYIGRGSMLLKARRLRDEGGATVAVLLAFQAVAPRDRIDLDSRARYEALEEALAQKQVLLEEIRHRVANSLQIIASILMLKARAVASEETRFHLQDAQLRVMSVAAVQQLLETTSGAVRIEVGAYLKTLVAGLSASMIGDAQPIAIEVTADAGTCDSADTVSLGLIVTELVINAIKYAFPLPKADARILIGYEVAGSDWKLSVSDNGVGNGGATESGGAKVGLGTTIVTALTKQLRAVMDISSGQGGFAVSITRATFTSRLPHAT